MYNIFIVKLVVQDLRSYNQDMRCNITDNVSDETALGCVAGYVLNSFLEGFL